MKGWAVALWLALAATAYAGYLPKGSPKAAGAENIVLIYNGGPYHRDWQRDDFLPLMTYMNASGRPTALMFDTLLVLPLWARSGRGYTTGFGTGPSNKDDWVDYADNTLFGGLSQLSKMDQAAYLAGQAIGTRGRRWKVILTIPYPDPAQTTWGTLDGSSSVLNFSLLNDRISAVRWWVSYLSGRWSAARFQYLDLVGMYWLNESISSSDASLMSWTSATVHGAALKLFWIPYYGAAGWSAWSSFGIDAAMLQPNYFFTLTVPEKRLYDAASGASKYGLGLELELDDRAISDTSYRPRYYDYLRVDREQGVNTGALTAWYMGGDTLLKCQQSAVPVIRAIYDDTFSFILADGKRGDASGNRVVDTTDVRTLLRDGGGVLAASGTNFANQTDVVTDGRADIADAVKLLRYLSGLDPTLP